MKQFIRASSSDITVAGATAPDGSPWVEVRACGRKAWVPLAEFYGSGSAAHERLARSNIVLLDDSWKRCVDKANEIYDGFPPKPLIAQPGWSEPYFALPDGHVVSPSGSEEAIVLFDKATGKCGTAGFLSVWLSRVAAPLAGQHLPTFVLMAAFAAPMLSLTNRSGNFGFEIAGEKGLGKSTIQQIASSVLGPPLDQAGPRYWISGNATVNGLESALEEHSDLPMIIEEMALYAGATTGSVKAGKLSELVFMLANGRTKARHRDHAQSSFNFLYLTSTNEPLSEVLAGLSPVASSAAADRLMTLPVDREPHGVFDFIPTEFDTSTEFAASLVSAMAENHGWAIRRFLTRLVEHRAKDEGKLKARIAKLQASFRQKVGVDLNNGSAARVADAFGLVYAAGKLAKKWGALPQSLKCLAAAKVMYARNQAALPDARLPSEQLVKVAGRGDLITLNHGRLPKLTDKELAKAPGFLKKRKDGSRLLIFTPEALRRLFPDLRRLWADPSVTEMLLSDAKRKGGKRDVRSNKSGDRVYTFLLPAEPDDTPGI